MIKVRVTERDATLPHQIHLTQSGHVTKVMCNCRHDALGVINPQEDPWPIYNDPKNHNHMRAQFEPGQTTGQKVYSLE